MADGTAGAIARDMARSIIPKLERHCGSWIVTSPSGQVVELFEASNVEKAAAAGWTIETAAVYLGRIGRAAR